jgi:hypothetical protein
MTSRRDLNSSWDVLEGDTQDESASYSPLDSSSDEKEEIPPIPNPPTRRNQRAVRRSTPTQNQITKRRTSRRTTPHSPIPSIEASQDFVMPSPFSPPNSFISRRRSARLNTPATETSSPKPRRTSKRSSRSKAVPVAGSTGSFKDLVQHFAFSAARYLIQLTFDILSWLNLGFAPVLAVLIAVLISYILAWWVFQQTIGQMPTALSYFLPKMASPCALPVISLLPVCKTSAPSSTSQPAEFSHLMEVQSDFNRVLDLSEAAYLFPLELSRAETPILELRDVIKHQSQLPSKADIIMQLDHFVSRSRDTHAHLSTFTSHLGGAADKIIFMNRHTLRVLSALIDKQESQSMLSRLWSTLTGRPYGINEYDVLKQYRRHAESVENNIDGLILEGEAVLQQLNGMEEMLDSLREAANHDYSELKNSQDELFAQLWTIFGGNSADKKRIKKNIAIAHKLRDTRGSATVVVQLTIDELRRIKNGLVDLQARVMEPVIRGTLDRIEIEEHVQYVQDGLDRLYSRREQGKARREEGIQAMLTYSNQVFKQGGRKIDKLILPELESGRRR